MHPMKAFSDRPAGEMTLARIIRYAGVIGDFNPIHHDDAFARNAGLPSVIAHGPLTFTMALDVLVAEAGLDKLSGFSCRFKAPVFPGNKVSVSCTEDGEVVAKADGKEVLTGKATPRES
ncbi:MAG: MaoC family dehydratase [SAR324 cluster bacterium]|nr:MaoC family dehydratase [SAR324 cluster bacterium]